MKTFKKLIPLLLALTFIALALLFSCSPKAYCPTYTFGAVSEYVIEDDRMVFTANRFDFNRGGIILYEDNTREKVIAAYHVYHDGISTAGKNRVIYHCRDTATNKDYMFEYFFDGREQWIRQSLFDTQYKSKYIRVWRLNEMWCPPSTGLKKKM